MIDRRKLLKILAATGVGTGVFHRAVSVLAGTDSLTAESIREAAWITDLELSNPEIEEILAAVDRQSKALANLRKKELSHLEGPAFQFKTLAAPEPRPHIVRSVHPCETAVGVLPEEDEDIAFLPVSELSQFIRTRQLSSRRLTQIYLSRLKKYGPMLRCVVNITENLALNQADQADREIAAGRYRGPLHGIPWGAKDLIAVPGYPTTWGIPHLKDQVLDDKATVYARLENAGAVLVAKLSLGALAMGDKWYQGRTRNPWNPRIGSSGSSAGSASAVVAGLVGFALGSETLGSITSPARVCGASGFRPTFGRVSRYGCMPLSWTMDKIGPLCRDAEDCALVFATIHGADGLDTTAQDRSFSWPQETQFKGLKIGYAPGKAVDKRPELTVFRDLGCQLVEVRIPSSFPIQPLANVINVEAASVFDAMLREGHTEGWNQWTNIFKATQYVSAIDYIRLMRLRTRLMQEFEEFMTEVDFLFNVFDVFHTNLTGHPTIVMPRRLRERAPHVWQPITVSLTGHLNDDARLLSLAHTYQANNFTDFQKPALDHWLSIYDSGALDKKKSKPAQKPNEDSKKSDG